MGGAGTSPVPVVEWRRWLNLEVGGFCPLYLSPAQTEGSFDLVE